jgi:uncharacterized protein (TIGR02453 family)
MNFTGFPAEGLDFLRTLAAHNDPAWFKPRRDEYEALVRGPMLALVADLLTLAAAHKLPLTGDPAKSVFRIHRDVRFAKDKSPYKTNVGAVMTRIGGAKNEPGLFYVHVAVEGCFTAAGFYDPAPETLARLRAAMARAPKAWKQTLAKLDKAGLAPSPDYALKRNPRGFEDIEDEAILAGLRYKSIIVTRPLPEARIAEPALVEDLVDFARAALPLLAWGWDAIADTR